jgi:hypothetical protein
VTEPEPPAQPAQLGLVGAREAPQLAHDAGHMAREDPADQPAAALGEAHRHHPPVLGPPLLADQAPAHQVAHHHGGVAAAAQQLASDLALRERAVVEQRLQRTELADGEIGGPHHVAHPRRHRLRRAHQLDVGVEGSDLVGGAGVAGRHRSNLNGL